MLESCGRTFSGSGSSLLKDACVAPPKRAIMATLCGKRRLWPDVAACPRSSAGQSAGLLIRWSQVRILPGALGNAPPMISCSSATPVRTSTGRRCDGASSKPRPPPACARCASTICGTPSVAWRSALPTPRASTARTQAASCTAAAGGDVLSSFAWALLAELDDESLRVLAGWLRLLLAPRCHARRVAAGCRRHRAVHRHAAFASLRAQLRRTSPNRA
jgi:hypothetical protein